MKLVTRSSLSFSPSFARLLSRAREKEREGGTRRQAPEEGENRGVPDAVEVTAMDLVS